MALAKTYEVNNSGVNVSYWVVGEVCVTPEKNKITFNGYLDAAARTAGKRPLTHHTVEYYGDNRPITRQVLIDGNGLQACYDKVVAAVPDEDLISSRFFVGCSQV